MLTTRSVVSTFSIVMMALSAGVVLGQNFPSKPIRIITPEPGSGIDFQVRVIAPAVSAALGQSVIIDNRPPALIAETVAKSPPDGYTLAAGASSIWVTPLLQKTPYDPVKNFAPITLLSTSPYFLVVHSSMPVKSVKELIALAKARPGELNYATGPTGGGTHLAGALFNALAGVNSVRVAYKGSSSGVTALLAGEVHMMIADIAPVAPYVKAGRLRALAVTSAEPTALAPGLPTLASLGLTGYEAATIAGILAPAGTPAAVIARLNQEMVRALTAPDVKEKIFNGGADAAASSPEQFAAKIKSEMAKWGKVLNDAGIRVE